MQLPCEKRRRILRRNHDGTERELFRCAHGMADTYGKEVSDDICQACVLRIAGLTKLQSLCNQAAPSAPSYEQPVFGPNLEIIYKKQVGVDPPPCPEGYHPSPTNNWEFISDWIACPKRIFNNILDKSGAIIVQATCSLTNQPVSCSDCSMCSASLPPDYPGFQTQLNNYWEAIKRWVSAGRPERSAEEVKLIHEKHCVKCSWYDAEAQRCRGCGCKVRAEGIAIFNKIKMATEHCPQHLW